MRLSSSIRPEVGGGRCGEFFGGLSLSYILFVSSAEKTKDV